MTNRKKMLALVGVLAILTGYYVYENREYLAALAGYTPPIVLEDKSASLPLDEQTKASIRHYFEGVSLDPKENDLNHAMSLDHSVGRPQISQGKYREAYRTYQKVLAISYRQGNLMGVGIGLMMMADTAHRADNLDEALFANLLAYKVAGAMKNKEEMGVVELAFARMLQEQDRSSSVMWLLRAKENLKDSRYKEDYVRALPSLAKSLCCLGEDAKVSASKVLEEAWELARSLGDSPTHKWTKTDVGTAYVDDLIRAQKYEKASEVSQIVQGFFAAPEKGTDGYTGILYRLALSQMGLKRPEEASRTYLSAYANYELTRASAPGEEARALLDKNHKGLVDDFVGHYLQTKDLAAALALLESNKARTLNDIFEDPSYKQAQGRWKEMEQRHARELADLVEKKEDELALNQGRDLLPKVVALMQKQEDERRKLQADLQLKEMTATRSLSKEHVEEIRRQLPPDVAVISFFMRKDRASVFLMTRRAIQHFPLPADSAEILKTIQQLRVALTNPHNDFYREPAQWLFKKSLKPVLKGLPGAVKILVYSPDGLLSRIPLEVLMDREQFLVNRYAVYRVPSLRYARSIAKVKAPPVAAGIACVDPEIANARLPFQRETGQSLAKQYGDKLTSLVGRECSENKLVAAIKNQKQPFFLHIGAHGNFYPVNAMESAIWLSPEEASNIQARPWNAKAMATVDMNHVDLATLSSCETGLTDPNMPRDVFGIARALFFAGAKSMVAPLWAVHDQATAEFMQAFHSAYGRDMPAVLALQQAQRSLMKNEKYRHPFYWSAFVLTGATR